MSQKTVHRAKLIIKIFIIIVPLVFFSFGFFAPGSERILTGIMVMGTDLSGLDRSEGMLKLAELERDLQSTRLVLLYQDRAWPLLLSEAGFDLNEEAILEEAISTGRQGSLIRRWQDRKQIKNSGCSIYPHYQIDHDKLSRRVSDLTSEITVEPVNASFEIIYGDKVAVVPSKDGVGVDIEKLKNDIEVVLIEGHKPELTLSLITIAPLRTTAVVERMGVTGLLASYTTVFDPAKVSRSYNINVAARAFDELLVRPGHMVSFNEVVGPRSFEAGYKTAPVIINDEFVDGIGGGVCQVSTTLYNCILLADLQVVERYNHSLPVGYVPIGLDATVVYNNLDLKFCNNTDSYLYLKTTVKNGQVSFNIYGDAANKRDVLVNIRVVEEIEPTVVYETDPNLPKGEEIIKQQGASGYKSAAERVVSLNGVVMHKEELPSSYYSPVNKIIAVGTMTQNLPQIAPSTLPSEAWPSN